MSETSEIVELAAEIRRVDGTHSLGAAALADALGPWLAAHDRRVAARTLRLVGSEIGAVTDRFEKGQQR